MDPVHVVAVIDEETGHEALYVGGELFLADATIYCCDVARAAAGKVIQFTQIQVSIPEDEHQFFPQQLDRCMLWKPVKQA